MHGYLPIKHRHKSRIGEIDLIFKSGSEIVFCEVKCRSSNFASSELVSKRQQARLIRSAEDFLAQNPRFNFKTVRMDIALVKSLFNVVIYKNWSI